MDSPTEPTPDEAPWWYVTWVEAYITDPALWPVVFAIAGHITILIVPVLLGVIRTQHPVYIVVLLGMVLASLEVVRFEVQYRRRPKGMSLVVLLTWLAALPITWIALDTGFL